ncbi:thymidylate kinase [Capsulimonas corticalis]|uniref:Thymidylate kinase n=1 Tax=Capsulimonas corticalis TaxID=2219043 RepID=A0A402D501_9BACT|nr:dTMP kinase [Capsulimonas corticalis]BDI31972.1 thymidylate kinase [Capsulimonas corticalis]
MSLFVTFEGVEGAGKTTQIVRLATRLRSQGRQDILVTREPGDGPLCRELRQLVLDPPVGVSVDERAELFIMLADRSQHVAHTVRPHLDNGGVVLCDRYIDSSMAYQGFGRGLDRDAVASMNAFATGGLLPHRTLLLDVDPGVGLTRQTNRTRMEAEAIAFHAKIREGFLQMAAAEPGRFRIIDASLPPDNVHDLVWEAVQDLLDDE